jgi:ureidoglycolate lyase
LYGGPGSGIAHPPRCNLQPGARAIPKTVHIPVEPASHEAFAPFGQLISEQDTAPAFHGDGLRSWRLAYDIDGTTELMFIRYEYKPMIFSTIERHFNVTQCFIPLAGTGVVMVVAPRTDETDRSALPAPESLRAFLVEGSSGVLLWKGVWHALNRFPVQPPGAGFALLTTAETQSELVRQLHEDVAPLLTHAVDYETHFGIRFEVVDPHGMLPRAV